MDIIVGTAGHIDHGKTALVRALTGTDTDRLPEEKRRGITIDLGFADMQLDGMHVGIVDVPGHERFVKNMLAGASGIDLVMLVVAADEGIMPQTIEHFDVCRLLNVQNGLIAMTKADLVDDEMLELVRDEITEHVSGTFLEDAPIVAVSSRSGRGLDELRAALASSARKVAARPDDRIARLPVDRSFVIKGFGTVVTGTLLSGRIVEGTEMVLLPEGRRVRVRGIQSHGQKFVEGLPGRRTAVNLAGIDHSDVARGMLLTEPDVIGPRQIYDVEVEVLASAKPLKSGQRVRMHIGTAEVLARITILGGRSIAAGETRFAQLRLESNIAAISGERYILRSYSPQTTIGGGSIIRPAREKAKRRHEMELLRLLTELKIAAEDKAALVNLLVTSAGEKGMRIGEIRSITGYQRDRLKDAAAQLVKAGKLISVGDIFISPDDFERLAGRVLSGVETLHRKDPIAATVSIDKLRSEVFSHAAHELESEIIATLVKRRQISVDGDGVSIYGRNADLSPAESTALDLLRTRLSDAGLGVPKMDEILGAVSSETHVSRNVVRRLLQQLLDSGEVVRVTSEFMFSSRVMEDLLAKVRKFADSAPDRSIDVGEFKDLAGVSRKYAIPLLEYFDQQKVTARRGDKRLVL